MTKKTVEDIDVSNKRVLVRVDFNVPLTKDGTISDDTRIRACLPTIKYLIDNHAHVILCSHLGRPEGKIIEGLRLAPVAQRLSELLGKPVTALSDCIGAEVEAAISQAMGRGGVSGVSCAIINDSKIVYRKAFGYKDVDAGTENDEETKSVS